SNRLYAGSESGGGIYRTLDAGDHWAEANAGFTNSEISTIAASGSAPGLIYAAARGRGAYASVDGGNTWVFKSALGFGITYSLATDPVDPNIVYQAPFDGVFKTTNGGGSWKWEISGMFEPYDTIREVRALAIDGGHRKILYASTQQRMFKSTNGGD